MNEFYCVTNQASRIAEYQNSGYDARSLIAPEPITIIENFSHKQKVKSKVLNHQAEHRRRLSDMQHRMSRRLSDEKKNESRKKDERESWKKKVFEHVRSKVFEDSDSSIQTVATIGSSVEELSSLPSLKSKDALDDRSLSTTTNSSSRHKYFGEIPEYILKRRIMNGRRGRKKDSSNIENGKHNSLSVIDDDLIPSPSTRKEAKMLQSKLDLRIEHIRSELRSLPFGLQSVGSIKKREKFEHQLKEIEKEKKMLAKRTFMR